jgi:MFS family permease
MDRFQQMQADALAELRKNLCSSAGWFYWIAGLSILNTILILAGVEVSFVVGLGVTIVVDAIGMALVEQEGLDARVQWVTTILSVAFSLLFVFFGYAGTRQWMALYVVGMVLYGLDAVLCLVLGSYMQFGFHLLALFFLYKAFPVLKELRAFEGDLAKLQPVPSPAPMAAE